MANKVKSYRNGKEIATPVTSVAGQSATSYIDGEEVTTPVASELIASGGVTSVNEQVPDENGNIAVYSDNIKINPDNSNTVQYELERLGAEKLDLDDFRISKALDMENITEGEIGLMAHVDGQFQIGGLVREKAVNQQKIELTLTNNVTYTNQVVNGIIPFDNSLVVGTTFSVNGYGLNIDTTPILLNGYSRININMTASNPFYPVTITVTVVIDGIKTSNSKSYEFTRDENFLFQLDNTEDATSTGAGQKVEFNIEANKPLTSKEKLTIFANSFVNVSDRGVNDEGLVIPRNFIQKTRLSLKNSNTPIAVNTTPTLVNFTGEADTKVGTGLSWSILQPSRITATRKCDVLITYVEQLSHSSGATGLIEVRVYINGVFQQNYFRKKAVQINTIPTTVEFIGGSLQLNEGDYLQIYSAEVTGTGTTQRITNTDHVANLLTLHEI